MRKLSRDEVLPISYGSTSSSSAAVSYSMAKRDLTPRAVAAADVQAALLARGADLGRLR